MKLTTAQLKRIIKEELDKVLFESSDYVEKLRTLMKTDYQQAITLADVVGIDKKELFPSDEEIRDMANKGGHKDGGKRMMQQRDQDMALGMMSKEEAGKAAVEASAEAHARLRKDPSLQDDIEFMRKLSPLIDFSRMKETYSYKGPEKATKIAYEHVADQNVKGEYQI